MNPSFFSYLKAIIAFSLIIIVHEFGHFIAGKLSKIEVLEAALGLGPKLFKTKIKDTIYAICCIPVGGYVKFLGQDPLENIPLEKRGVAFRYKSIKKRFLTVIAGPLFNYITAILLLAIAINMGIYFGTTKIEDVLANTPAQEAKFMAGDEIIRINGEEVETWDDITEIISEHPGEKLEFQVKRDGMITILYPRLTKKEGSGFLGIATVVEKRRVPFLKALVMGAESTIMTSYHFLVAIPMLIIGKIPLEYARPISPIGVVKLIAQTDITYGIQSFLQLLGMMSVIIAIGNLIPILPLDGGHILFMIIEKVIGKKVNPKVIIAVSNIGTLILIVIFLFAFYLDIFSPIDISFLR